MGDGLTIDRCLAGNRHIAGPRRGIVLGLEQHERGILTGINRRLAGSNMAGQAAQGNFNRFIEAIPLERHDLDRQNLTPSQECRGHGQRLVLQRRRAFHHRDQPEIRRFLADGQTVEAIGRTTVEQVIRYEPVGSIGRHHKPKGRIQGGGVERRTADVYGAVQHLFHSADRFLAFIILNDAFETEVRIGRHA